MATLSKRAQILFTPSKYAKLKDEAQKSQAAKTLKYESTS